MRALQEREHVYIIGEYSVRARVELFATMCSEDKDERMVIVRRTKKIGI